MKKYRVTVNGTVYEVELEELTNAPAPPRCRTHSCPSTRSGSCSGSCRR